MRAYEIFARMTPERAVAFVEGLRDGSPIMVQQALAAAAAAMKARPVYLKKKPIDKQAAAIRRALARVVANGLAEEMLAVYFLECRQALLVEWLDTVGVEHEEGTLKEDAPAQPDAAKLAEAVATFRAGEDTDDRELLLQAFSAQSAIDWPALDALITPSST